MNTQEKIYQFSTNWKTIIFLATINLLAIFTEAKFLLLIALLSLTILLIIPTMTYKHESKPEFTITENQTKKYLQIDKFTNRLFLLFIVIGFLVIILINNDFINVTIFLLAVFGAASKMQLTEYFSKRGIYPIEA